MPQGKSVLGLGPGDWTAKPTMNGKMNGTATTCQATVLTNAGVLIQKGRVVVCDIANVASRSTVTAVEGDPDCCIGNFMLPAAVGELLHPCGILTQDVLPGQPCKPQFSGVARVLSAATLAVNALVTVSFAADNSRGCVVAAASNSPIFGRVIQVGSNGTANAPQLCTVLFDGNTAFSKLVP